jgi:hypothetical protein
MMPGTNESSELGMKVKIMLDWDLKGKQGPMTPLLDMVTIYTPKEEFSTCTFNGFKKNPEPTLNPETIDSKPLNPSLKPST